MEPIHLQPDGTWFNAVEQYAFGRHRRQSTAGTYKNYSEMDSAII
jgi:hypothetical protein